MQKPGVTAAIFRRHAMIVLSFVCVSLAAALPLEAQSGNLSGLLLRFFSPDNPIILAPPPPDSTFPSHAAHFESQAEAQRTLTQLNAGIVSQLSTFPLGSSSGGFTYTYEPTLGVFDRSTETFGPVFAERAFTAGKHKFSMGVSYLHSTYDSFENHDLEGEISFFLTHQDVNSDGSELNPFFEGDIIRADLFLGLSTDTAALFLNYGLTDRFDAGLVVPVVRVEEDARIVATVDRLSTGAASGIHSFPDGTATKEFRESGEATGLGDIIVRAKYNFVRSGREGLAFALDVRLPTGDEDELLGTGATQTKASLIWSAEFGKVSPHLNAGYTFSSGGSDDTGDLPDEINYTAGFDFAIHPRFTFAVDAIGRSIRNAARLEEQERVFRFRTQTDPTVQTAPRSELVSVEGNLDLWLGSTGFKFNPFGNFLFTANVLFSLSSDGLQDDWTPVVGIEYSF